MDSATYLAVARRQDGAINRRQLRAAGIDSRALQRRLVNGHLDQVAPQVFVVAGAPRSWRQQLWTCLLTARPGSAVSRRAAARTHHIGPFGNGYLDISQPEDPFRKVPVGDGHRSLLLPAHHVTEVDGLPVTTIARTVFDLAGQASIKRRRRGLPYVTIAAVARTLDDALSAGTPRTAFVAILDELGSRGRGGTVLMRELLMPRSEGYEATESALEDLVLSVLSDAGLAAPARQRTLGDQRDLTGRVDFVYLSERIVIEADGRKHHTALIDQENDRWRDLELTAAGYVVVRITWRQLREDPARFTHRIRQLLEARRDAGSGHVGPRPPGPSPART